MYIYMYIYNIYIYIFKYTHILQYIYIYTIYCITHIDATLPHLQVSAIGVTHTAGAGARSTAVDQHETLGRRLRLREAHGHRQLQAGAVGVKDILGTAGALKSTCDQ